MTSDPLDLNIHLMHPGGPSAPGDPNVAFHIDGVYHLHYIVKHKWRENASFSFMHITSSDMLQWDGFHHQRGGSSSHISWAGLR